MSIIRIVPILVLLLIFCGCGTDTSDFEYELPSVLDTPHMPVQSVSHVYPEPTGSHKVGVQEFDVLSYHQDALSPVPGELRNLHIKVFYPSDTSSTNYKNYFDSWGNQVAYLTQLRPENMPIHPQQHELSTMSSWSIDRARIADNNGELWPVLFYSHGMGLFEVDNTELLEQLASSGFFVISINHTYVSGITTFENGETSRVYFPEGKGDVQTEAGRLYFDNVIAPQIAQDVLLVHQWLSWHQGRFDYRIDVSNVGMLGFSLGASAAMNACQQLNICKAAANLDGIVLGPVATEPLNKPLLLMRSQDPFSNLQQTYLDNMAESHLISIANSQHNDFTDQGRWIVGYPARVHPDIMHDVVKTSVVRFFASQLNNRQFSLPQWEGVTVVSK